MNTKNTKPTKAKNLPNVSDVEEVVLGSILLDSTVIDRIVSDFTENLFYEWKNRLIARTILELYKNNTAIDIVTLVNNLMKKEQLDDVGGAVYVSQLTSNVASTSNIEYHIRILQQESLRRRLIEVGTNATTKSLDPSQDVFDLYNETQIELDDALKKVINYSIKSAGEIHDEIIRKSIIMLNSNQKSGVPTGFTLVDNFTNGWQSSDLIICAGRPGMGKTALALSMCVYPCLEENHAVAIFSLEMSNEQLVSRLQSNLSGINVSKIVKKQLNVDEINDIVVSGEKLKDAPIFIDDTPNISLLDLKGKARKLKKEHDIKLIVVDYLQLMRSGQKISNREQEIAEISRGLKALAKELDIPVVALSQLSRGVESRADKKPMLQDLRESGQIEQDADMVVFCYRPEYYGIEQYEVGDTSFNTNGLFMLLVAKHRNGELGEIPLQFIHEQTKITNYSFNPSHRLPNPNNRSTFVQQDVIEPMIDEPISALKPNMDFSEEIENLFDTFEEPPF